MPISSIAVKDGRWSSARERLRRKKNRFINFIRLPLHFPSVLRFPLPLNIFVRNGLSLDEREDSRQSSLFARSDATFRFSLSRPISAEDIRPAIRARNLNKTNQYSNPPFSFSLAGSLSVTPLLPLAFFLPYLFCSSLFPAALLRLRRPPSSARSLSRLLWFLIHWYNIEAPHLFASLCRIGRSPFQTFSTSVLIGFKQPEWLVLYSGELCIRFARESENNIR